MLWLILVLFSFTGAQSLITLQNQWIYLAFDQEFSFIFLAKNSSVPNLLTPSKFPLWSLDLLTNGNKNVVTVNSFSTTQLRHHKKKDSNSLTLHWLGVEVGKSLTVDVSLTISLSGGLANFKLNVDATHSFPKLALWSWKLSIGPQNLAGDAVVLENEGWGIRRYCRLNACRSFSGIYPALTYQFLSGYNPDKAFSGIYFGAHDPRGEAKVFQFNATSGERSGSYSISGKPIDAGRSFKNYESSYPVVLSVYDGDWWDAAQIYRAFVMKEATWTKKGHIRHRADTPKWLFSLTTWVNSHWQQNDIFNITGGDPEVVKNRVLNIVNRFSLQGGLGLHWYEWDLLGYEYGSNYTKCTSEVTCGFDTHYPEYFPVRKGFEASLATMQKAGVRVTPYINGRIFDMGTKSWREHNALAHMAKSVSPVLNSSELSIYEESYGSLAKFAVSCPHTKYWQNIITDTVSELIHKYRTNGVYIDQIAAAGPKACWDPTHGHTLGGGDYWVTGYRKMLSDVRHKSGNDVIVITEGSAEPFMDGVNMFLNLVGFAGDFEGPTAITPVFAGIYGGYYFSMGAEFFANDFVNPDVFASRVAKQYMFGAQLGWFSLGGRDNQNPYMGIYDQLMSPHYDAEIEYLKVLSAAKTTGNHWIQEGQAMRDLNVLWNGIPVDSLPRVVSPNSRFDTTANSTVSLSFSPLMSATWFNEQSHSLLVTISIVTKSNSGTISWTLQASKYGFPNSDNAPFELRQIFPKQEKIGDMKGCCISWKGQIEGRQVASFVLKPK